jgi:(S)-2-hydroxyglutarate dehydrogenase
MTRIAVVGGGIVGTAVARQFTRTVPDARVTVFEKETHLAAHQTGHNSGVVHAGLYYEPGSLKARLCRRGVELLTEYCAARSVPFDRCGKVVVARHPGELQRLEAIFGRAKANGVPGIAMIDAGRLRELEPSCTGGIAALHSPSTAIVDYPRLTAELAKDVEQAGGRVRLGATVNGLRLDGAEVRVAVAGAEEEAFDLVVTCAGLQADRLARSLHGHAGQPTADDGPRIVPFLGDYYLLRQDKAHLVRGLIYPVPDPRYPFLGVHLTKRVDGSVLLGPNAFLAFARENYTSSRPSLRDTRDTLSYPGFWQFAARNLPAAAREVRTAVSKGAFVREAQQFVPALQSSDVVRGIRGIRAQAMNADGGLVDDFVISSTGPIVQVRNAPSPGATASLAIAEYIVGKALEQLSLPPAARNNALP